MDIKNIRAQLRKEFSIILDANPTTGYNWEAEFNKSVLELKERRFERHPSAAIGGGGKEKLTFVPIRTGEADIIMRYKRRWEAMAIKETTFHIVTTE